MKHVVNIEIESIVEDVSVACVAMNAIHQHFSLPRLLCYQLELCLDEVLNNVIEHDLAFERGHILRISLKTEPLLVTIEITYTSKLETLTDWSLKNHLPDAGQLPERGFGCFLVNEIMDDVALSRKNGKTVVCMCKGLSEEARPRVKRERV